MLLGLLDGFGFFDWMLSYRGRVHIESGRLVHQTIMFRRSSCFATSLGVLGSMTSHDDFDEGSRKLPVERDYLVF